MLPEGAAGVVSLSSPLKMSRRKASTTRNIADIIPKAPPAVIVRALPSREYLSVRKDEAKTTKTAIMK